jgi:hypothetical protein
MSVSSGSSLAWTWRRAQRGWHGQDARELGPLFEDVRQGNQAQIIGRAGRLGRDHVDGLLEVHCSAESERPPAGCEDIHRSLMTWLDGLVRAREALIDVGTSGQMAGLRDVQRHVADARHAARRFNGEYARLVSGLRLAVRSVRR